MFSIRISNLIDRTKYKTGWSLFRGGLEITLVSTFEIRDQEFFPLHSINKPAPNKNLNFNEILTIHIIV